MLDNVPRPSARSGGNQLTLRTSKRSAGKMPLIPCSSTTFSAKSETFFSRSACEVQTSQFSDAYKSSRSRRAFSGLW
ncbi:hypothetical protein PoB_001896600 [Plakobranchus ocellatus]|uniref:Uncharacterized protein n=1 Tax=Plakobranchus ocellatus TaxID=259542 RepID=A0AAV3Z956_9GAST|nr:hypothetical protein PoB_001896600 [Plakobranchus ocellatus]